MPKSAQNQGQLALDDAGDGVCVQRWDRKQIPKGRARRTREGYLEILGVPIAKIGVQDYLNADGTTRSELRVPEHVFAADALATGERRPVVVEHPIELGGEVNADNARALIVGSQSNLRADQAGAFVLADILICAADAVAAVDEGKRDLSVGYRFKPVPLAGGVFREAGHAQDGAQADLLQTKIHINHLALVDHGRANVGDPAQTVRIRLDSAGNQSGLPGLEDTMPKKLKIGGRTFEVSDDLHLAFDASINIGSITYDVPAQVKAYVESITADMAKLKTGMGPEGSDGPREAIATISLLRAELAAAKAVEARSDTRADTAEGSLAVAIKKISDLEAAAAKAPGKEVLTADQRADHYDLVQNVAKSTDAAPRELVAKSTGELQRILAEKLTGQALDGKSEDYVAGVLLFAQEQAKPNAAEQGAKATGTSMDSKDKVNADSVEASALVVATNEAIKQAYNPQAAA